MSVVLQHGDLSQLSVVAPSGAKQTYFAKKQMLTHAGGKHDTVESKAASLFAKRAIPDPWPKDLPGTQGKKAYPDRLAYVENKVATASGPEKGEWDRRLALLRSEPKCGPQRTNATAFIVCDRVPPEDLKSAFARGLLAGPLPEDAMRKGSIASKSDLLARIHHPADAVVEIAATGP